MENDAIITVKILAVRLKRLVKRCVHTNFGTTIFCSCSSKMLLSFRETIKLIIF